MEMHEIEELIKGVNRNAIKAMLRNAAILGDEKATDEMKAQALENVKAIAANKTIPKKSKVKPVVAPAAEATQLVQPAPASPAPQPPTPVDQQSAGAATPSPTIQYPEGLHLSPLNADGHDEATMRGIFNSLPDNEKQHVVNWHSSLKMNKSIDSLYDLFSELKKRL